MSEEGGECRAELGEDAKAMTDAPAAMERRLTDRLGAAHVQICQKLDDLTRGYRHVRWMLAVLMALEVVVLFKVA